jgi:RNA-directed DNA polymerase
LPRGEQWVMASWLTAALRSRSTQRGSLRACRQAESYWRKERRAFEPTPKSRVFALQTDGAGAGSLSVWGSCGGGQCVESSFDAIEPQWMIKFIEHRIADKRVVRHIQKWLNAGVLEDGKLRYAECGTPQGGSISPLLANVYLHYALDLWVDKWRRTQTHNDVFVVRYADDVIFGFQTRADAMRFHAELRERLRNFGLELHAEKTRLIEFGRFAAENRQRRGDGKPETFGFLGFTHYCGKTRAGRFVVVRKTMKKKVQAKLQALKADLRRRMHAPVPEVADWLSSVLRGHFQYYGVPFNSRALSAFRRRVVQMWYKTLRRRSHKTRLTWTRMVRLARMLPQPRIVHPYPTERLCVITLGKSPVR